MCPAVVQENTIFIYVQCVFEIAITTDPYVRTSPTFTVQTWHCDWFMLDKALQCVGEDDAVKETAHLGARGVADNMARNGCLNPWPIISF